MSNTEQTVRDGVFIIFLSSGATIPCEILPFCQGIRRNQEHSGLP
jgi:hypothetical protein